MLKQSFKYLLFAAISLWYPLKSSAQLVPDNTLGSEGSKVNSIDELRSRIEGGAIRGDNLFHSFEEFGVSEGASIDFANPDGIANIFSRVTGSNVSEIFGSLGVDGAANLLLMNPNGIVFGENAAINVNGSFLATTAETINFGDGSQFSSSTNGSKPSLTVSMPTSLGFGSNPGDINIQGAQNNVTVEIPSFRVVTDDLPSAIAVNPQQNISLIGGKIAFDGGGVQAPGGNIELQSIGGNQTLKLLPENDWFVADSSSISDFSDISLNNSAYLDVSDERAGNINLAGRQIVIDDGSAILANTSLDTDNAINIRASELLELKGTSGGGEQNISSLQAINNIVTEARNGTRDINGRGNYYSVSVIAADVFSGSNSDVSGMGNAIAIDANRINVVEGAQIRTVSFAPFATGISGGNIRINSQNLDVRGTNLQDNSLSSLITSTNGISRFGDTGNIEIESSNLRVLDGAQVKVDSFGLGKIGTLSINSDYILVQGFERTRLSPGSPIINRSTIGTSASSDGIEGDRSGTINLRTKTLDVIEGGSIGSNSFGRNAAGELNIEAESISLIGLTDNSNFQPTSISATVARDSNPTISSTINENSSNAGNINIDTNQLQVLNGANITANSNSGDSGSIRINAQNIELNGSKPNLQGFAGGLSTSTNPRAIGQGGDIQINVNSLKILNGSIIRAISLGEGNAGSIDINAESIEVSGFDRLVEDPIALGRVSKINTGATKANGGNVTIESGSIEVSNLGTIQASTEAGREGGNITFNSGNIQLLDRAQISASAGGSGNGGNITINSNTILGLTNSDITANAVGGNGGNITINTESILGLESSQRLTAFSDITASSEFGIDGTVSINSPESNTEEDAVVVFKSYIPQTNQELISGTCLDPNRKNGGKLVYVGRGGVPENPYNFFDDEEIVAIEGVANRPASVNKQQGLKAQSELPSEANSDSSIPQVWSQGDPIINANAVKVGADGQTYLVAETQLQDAQSGCVAKTEVWQK